MKQAIPVFIAITILFVISSCEKGVSHRLDLSGTWGIELDSSGVGLEEGWQNKSFSQTIRIPGTTDEAGLGIEPEQPAFGMLTRTHIYIGPAWYQRKISVPESWGDKNITLFLERVLWESRIWVDDRFIGTQDALGTPHVHDLGILEKV